ncbi:MAG: hypothetical protein IKT40_12370 [Bacilli bacterium]|nr:hypothetical protein [Bacilli bacterium]
MINKIYKYPYAVIDRNNNITLSNNENNLICYPAFDVELKNVKLEIINNILHISGDAYIHNFIMGRTKIDESNINEIAESSIKQSNGFKLFGLIPIIKPYKYVTHWYALKDTKPYKAVLKNFKIIIKD